MPAGELTRRDLLTSAGYCTGAVCLACLLGPLTRRACAADGPTWAREIDFYSQLPDRKIQCFVCPLHCVLQDGETCFCRTRTNVAGRLFTRAYNNPCILSIDPIEKLPLNHFRPGSQTLTIGVGGCNVRCLYCQNWEHSQKMPDELKTFALTPDDAVAYARKKKVDTIAFSYTEPVAFLEYARDVAIAAKKVRLHVVVATAAFVEPEPLLELARHVDAFVVSLKGFDEEFYHRVCGIKLAPVLQAIETLKQRTKCWLELLNLVVPSYNDDPVKMQEMVAWVHEHVGDDVPLHFARFVPVYRLTDLPRTPVQTLEAGCAAGRAAGLRYVYTSNIAPHEANNTFCAGCGARVIERLGFKVIADKLQRGVCPECHHKLPGVWA